MVFGAIAAKRKDPAWRATERQLLLFGLVGGLQLGIDWSCFVGLSMLGLAAAPANLSGRVVSSVLGFWLNRSLTFANAGSRKAMPTRQLIRFIIGWALTALLSTLMVTALDHVLGLRGAAIGKLFVDGLLAIFSFWLSKHWIFR
ncbi:GtrA family protein [Stenotrophomonas rhizophila]|uniref:GtrA family protein n=1 Tax=Stenotrophomonas rhizophila TaxID=216778 RepID=UPI003519B0A6